MKSSRPNRRPQAGEWLLGAHAVQEALGAGRRKIYRLLMSADDSPPPQRRELMDLASRKRLPVEKISRQQMAALSTSASAAPAPVRAWIAAQVGPYPYLALEDLLERNPKVLLACDQIQDPQNLGSILRSVYALGGDGVILTEKNSAAVSPAVVRASSGACEHLAIARVVNLTRALEDLKKHGFWIAASTLTATQAPRRLPSLPAVLVLGNEHGGIRSGVLDKADLQISIPIREDFDSLNVAVAAGILLYELTQKL